MTNGRTAQLNTLVQNGIDKLDAILRELDAKKIEFVVSWSVIGTSFLGASPPDHRRLAGALFVLLFLTPRRCVTGQQIWFWAIFVYLFFHFNSPPPPVWSKSFSKKWMNLLRSPFTPSPKSVVKLLEGMGNNYYELNGFIIQWYTDLNRFDIPYPLVIWYFHIICRFSLLLFVKPTLFMSSLTRYCTPSPPFIPSPCHNPSLS